MDARSRLTSAAVPGVAFWRRRVLAYGEIVWVRRPDAGVKLARGESFKPAMVSQKAGSPGRSRVSRKAIARGRPDASAKPVCSCANLCCSYRVRDRGCGAHPVFPAPSDFEGKVDCKTSGT